MGAAREKPSPLKAGEIGLVAVDPGNLMAHGCNWAQKKGPLNACEIGFVFLEPL